MPARAFRCPECSRTLGTITRWAYRGTVHAKLRIVGRSILVEKTWRGMYVQCGCGKRVRLPDDIEVIVA